MPKKDELFHFNEAPMKIEEKWCDSFLVSYPTSYIYNGGIILDENGERNSSKNGKWYKGVKVPEPKTPKGFKLKSIGIGPNLNAFPPRTTKFLKPLNPERRITKKELQKILN